MDFPSLIDYSSSERFFLIFQAGGEGGTIRQAGGAFGKMEAAREEEYFYRKVSYSKLETLDFNYFFKQSLTVV